MLMELLAPFLELGATGALIGALIWIVRAFLAHLKIKDEKFTEIITNHLTHSTKVQAEIRDSNRDLTGAIRELKEKL